MKKHRPSLTISRAVARFRSLRKPDSFETRYTITPHVLGSGNYGVVKRAIHNSTQKEYAIKIIPRKVLSSNKPGSERYLKSEIEILRQIHHPNIVSLAEIHQTDEYIYLVMGLALGGELYEQLFVQGHYTERDARRIVHQILKGVAYLHSRDIVHRDLKPENLLLKDNSPQADIMITDFGLSTILPHENAVLLTACGTPGYVAPEVLVQTGYGREVDLWSLGVIAFCLLCGYTPFWGEDNPSLFEAIKSGAYEFEEAYWYYISPEAKQFITRLLQVDPDRRPTALDALSDPWFQLEFQSTPVDLADMVKQNMESKKTLRKAFNVVSAANAFQQASSRKSINKYIDES
ncbi:myosin light chain kinase [Dimargaris cristalligena]|uniref:Myosin light chain kinase n=1 Tax=Dimargaris cristalligena TaxID=215637 RepID=A0A4P9ZMV3_9FUNG|nr:myosin light chain kinase [Dimargaris cristalligena]|eukprot:RKP34724.1 myosin light chain kinase [Dimargaris cristalligena]